VRKAFQEKSTVADHFKHARKRLIKVYDWAGGLNSSFLELVLSNWFTLKDMLEGKTL